MTEKTPIDIALAQGELTALEYLIARARQEYDEAVASGDEFTLCYKAEIELWERVQNAKNAGEPIVLYAGNIPVELLWASGCVPVNFDYMQIRLAAAVRFGKDMIFAGEKVLPDCFCSMHKAGLGLITAKTLGFEPCCFAYATAFCDASNLGYGFVAKTLDKPKYEFDEPAFKKDSVYKYIASQMDSLIGFLEKVSGKKHDRRELEACLRRSNRSYELLEKCAELRKKTPCPLPGRMLIRNAWAITTPCLASNTAFLEQELAVAQKNAAEGRGYCEKGEKHRAVFVQNLAWTAEFATDYLEKEYGCACVADGIGEQGFVRFNTDSLEECYLAMAQRLHRHMGLHGVSWSNFELLDLMEKTIGDYKADVGIFAGHVGCRQTWAAVGMVSDALQKKFGISPMLLRTDGIDRGYKSDEEVKRDLAEYMDTVVGA